MAAAPGSRAGRGPVRRGPRQGPQLGGLQIGAFLEEGPQQAEGEERVAGPLVEPGDEGVGWTALQDGIDEAGKGRPAEGADIDAAEEAVLLEREHGPLGDGLLGELVGTGRHHEQRGAPGRASRPRYPSSSQEEASARWTSSSTTMTGACRVRPTSRSAMASSSRSRGASRSGAEPRTTATLRSRPARSSSSPGRAGRAPARAGCGGGPPGLRPTGRTPPWRRADRPGPTARRRRPGGGPGAPRPGGSCRRRRHRRGARRGTLRRGPAPPRVRGPRAPGPGRPARTAPGPAGGAGSAVVSTTGSPAIPRERLGDQSPYPLRNGTSEGSVEGEAAASRSDSASAVVTVREEAEGPEDEQAGDDGGFPGSSIASISESDTPSLSSDWAAAGCCLGTSGVKRNRGCPETRGRRWRCGVGSVRRHGVAEVGDAVFGDDEVDVAAGVETFSTAGTMRSGRAWRW